MIPKIIHYCWFGRNSLPKSALECIESWKKFFPDYNIKEWNEDNFDINIIPYTQEAYKCGKYAFVSDYARFYILNKEGGVYFDTDVEVIKPMDDIISNGAFMGFERDPDKWFDGYINPGLGFAMEANNWFLKLMLSKYKELHFLNKDGSLNTGKTIVHYTTDILEYAGLVQKPGIQTLNGITLYPSEYFAPINFVSRRLHITNNTRTIHRYMASWQEQTNKKVIDYLKHYLPEFVLIWINRLKNHNRRRT